MSNIEYHAREDWCAGKVTLCVMAMSTPHTGASMFFDLSPEQAERLALDLQRAVKQFRNIDAQAEKDLAPKKIFSVGDRVSHTNRKKHKLCFTGTVLNVTSDEGHNICVRYDDGYAVWSTPKDLVVIDDPVQKNVILGRIHQRGCPVHLKMDRNKNGIVAQYTPNDVSQVPVLYNGSLGAAVWTDVQDLEVSE